MQDYGSKILRRIKVGEQFRVGEGIGEVVKVGENYVDIRVLAPKSWAVCMEKTLAKQAEGAIESTVNN